MKNILIIYVTVLLTIIVVTAVLAIRLPDTEQTHIHSNFGIFVDGEKLDFGNEKYMHSVPCTLGAHRQWHFGDRVHLHDDVGDVAHIHDSGVVWGDLLMYLGVEVTNGGIVFEEKNFEVTGQKKLEVFVNGRKADDFKRIEIKNNDTLIINLELPERGETGISEERMKILIGMLSMRSEEMNNSPVIEACGGRASKSFWQKTAEVWGF